MTTITITDPALVDQLLQAGAGELEDDAGVPLVTFSLVRPVPPGGVTRADVRVMRLHLEEVMRQVEAEPLDATRDFKPPPGFKLPPLTDRGPAHLQHGKPLLEALRDLEERLRSTRWCGRTRPRRNWRPSGSPPPTPPRLPQVRTGSSNH